MVDAALAFRECQEITREQAGNFFYGIRLLPHDKRDALCAVYALARRIDDIGDGDLPRADKLAALARLRVDLAHIDALDGDPVAIAVQQAARRYPIPIDAFRELVDGVEQDVVGHEYQDFEDLVGYCRLVAGSIGRLCLSIFGSAPDPRASSYADSLGVALQQTNILRDIREDLLNGRVYLPRNDLARFGVRLEVDPDGVLRDDRGRLSALIRAAVARADAWYAEGLRLVPLLDRRSAACCTAMSGIYRELLERIGREPSLVFGQRLSLTPSQKASVALRALAGRAA
jgi:phytoene synthase